MGNIPGPQKERFYEKKYVVELIAVLPPLVTAAVGALVSLADPTKRTLGWWLAGATAWLALASAVKVLHAAAQDKERKRSRNHDGLRGSLWVLYETVRAAAGPGNVGEGALRVTIHRVVEVGTEGPETQRLEQLLPYIGGPGGPPRRLFSVRSGAIGLAVRKKDVVAVNRKSDGHADFVRELVKEWCYTQDEARAVTGPAGIDGGADAEPGARSRGRGVAGLEHSGVLYSRDSASRSRLLSRCGELHSGGVLTWQTERATETAAAHGASPSSAS